MPTNKKMLQLKREQKSMIWSFLTLESLVGVFFFLTCWLFPFAQSAF